jgi:4-amino-4-deoxy-L-arabinose transferase-like glycosyltransferase
MMPWGLVVFFVACVVFGFRLSSEPHFVDESAYISQSFYADLLLDGRHNDPSWFDYAAFDIPPLPKYLIGIALRIGGFSRPGPLAASAWYRDVSKQFVSIEALTMARVPSVLIGAFGCLAIFAIGRRAFGTSAGVVAAVLLMISPLYRLHSRRAMSDVPAEAFLLITIAIGLAAWSNWVKGNPSLKDYLGIVFGCGICIGLSVLSKLNGTLAGIILGSWMLLALSMKSVTLTKKVTLTIATIAAGAVSFGVFVALNPFLTARSTGRLNPALQEIADLNFTGRVKLVAEHRMGVATSAAEQFPHDALKTLPDKLSAIAVQGYGRFSPLGPSHSDSTRRFDWVQDWGATIWIPIVLVGLVIAIRVGLSQKRATEPPTAFAIIVAAFVALVAVTWYIPLAWDRYYLSIQPGAILLASAALTAPLALLHRNRPESN